MPGCSKKEDYIDENSLGMVPVEIMEIRTEYGIIRFKAAKMGDTNINAPLTVRSVSVWLLNRVCR